MVKLSPKKQSCNYSNRQNKESEKSVLAMSSEAPCDTLNGL